MAAEPTLSEPPRRPKELAQLLLATSDEPPRQRARDQQADRAGLAIRRRVLERLAGLDPDPEALAFALATIVCEFGEPSGPTRGICALFREEWGQATLSPPLWDWLRSEALAAASGEGPRRRRRRGPGTAP